MHLPAIHSVMYDGMCTAHPLISTDAALNVASGFLKNTGGAHDLVINMASDSVTHLASHSYPDYMTVFAITAIKTIMDVGDAMGTKILDLYFDIVQFILTLC